jgi:hypothetical protein
MQSTIATKASGRYFASPGGRGERLAATTLKERNRVMRAICRLLSAASIGLLAATSALAGDLIYGCWNRPTCGKYCKLVCETTKITVVGYGSKCDTICVPGPSCMGCKHCSVECCPADSCGPCGTMDGDVCCGPCCKKDCCCEGAPAKLEFCWRDWFARGCAKPRTIKLLTKYQAEKAICWYHWEVVDACAEAEAETEETNAESGSEGLLQHPLVYKSAPDEAQLGDVLPITDDERARLATYLPAEQRAKTSQFAGNDAAALKSGKPATSQPQVQAASATSAAEPTSVKQRLIEFFNR